VPGSGFVPRIHARALQRHRRHRVGLGALRWHQQVDGATSGTTAKASSSATEMFSRRAILQVGRDRPADVVHALGGKPLGEVVGTPATAVP